jgi:uncharacterized membrane protein YgcG
MNNKTPSSNIEHRLEELKNVPPRNPLKAASGRALFLNEAAEYEQAVSPGKESRQSGWIFPIRKEKFAMNAVVSLILAVSLLLGGGATVAAAQDDLPNQSLYQLKLWTENAKMAMTGEPQEQATLLMNMAQTRVQEMAALAEQGIIPPDQVRARLETHLNQALHLAVDMDQATRDQILLQLRDRLQTQDRIMQQLQLHVDADIEPLLTQTRQMLQIRLQLVDEGLADPQGFQYMMQNQMQYGQDEEIVPEPNQQGEPGFHQNEDSGQPAEVPGNGEGSEAPGGTNPDAPKSGNGSNGSGNDASPGGSNSNGQQGGQDGSNNSGGSGNGGSGGNK